GGEPLRLPPKVFDTLVLLVENQGCLVGKEEFLERLWPGTYVGEDTLAQNISLLRKLLGDADGAEEYIETVPKRGYRFVAPVRQVAPVAADDGARAGVDDRLEQGSQAETGSAHAARQPKQASTGWSLATWLLPRGRLIAVPVAA